MTNFTIIYNNGAGKMTINLEQFFERETKAKRRFHNIKTYQAYKLFNYINELCTKEQIEFILNWLTKNDCQDMVNYYKKKYLGE